MVDKPEGFLLIAITDRNTPRPPRERAAALCRALSRGRYDRVHLRLNSPQECMDVLSFIPGDFHPRISVHNSTPEIVRAYPLVGVHLTGASPVPPEGFDPSRASLSISCHSAEEIRALSLLKKTGANLSPAPAHAPAVSYAFLSPIRDSLSKPGYCAAFNPEELTAILHDAGPLPVVALGGMTPDLIPEISAIGFAGMALLGAAKI